MKNINRNTELCGKSVADSVVKGSTLVLSALLLCGLAISTSAQEAARSSTAAEKGFTVVPNVQTAIVLKTMPDAACDLHAEVNGEPAHNLRFYANGDGYVKIHAIAKQESEEGIHALLDCHVGGKAVRYPLHLRASSSPTPNMPAPQTALPTPKGS